MVCAAPCRCSPRTSLGRPRTSPARHRRDCPRQHPKDGQRSTGQVRRIRPAASERADEATCRSKGYAGRPGYIGQLEHSFASVRQLASVVEPDEKTLHAAVDEVIAFANRHVLATDITPIVTALSATGEFRYSHRIPPGFHDNKEENKFGDVVIWEELVTDMVAASVDTADARYAVLVSRDRKTDWVSGAHAVTDAGRHAKANRDEDYDVILARPPARVPFDADNPVRFIDAFVDGLNLASAGFARVEAKAMGRPGYAPTCP